MGFKIKTCVGVFFLAGALVACDSGKSSNAADDVSTLRDSAVEEDTSAAAKALEKPEGEATLKPQEPSRPSATSPNKATLNTKPLLDISGLLTAEDLKGLTDAKIDTEALAGKAAAHNYNGTRLYPAGADVYGVGLQVWRLESDGAAVAFVDKMRPQYLSVDEMPKGAPVDGTRGFSSNRSGIQIYVFAPEGAGGYVAAISCGKKFCQKGPEELNSLADKVDKRLKSLGKDGIEDRKAIDKAVKAPKK